MFCAKCGEQLPSTIKVCPNCGGNKFTPNNPHQSKNTLPRQPNIHKTSSHPKVKVPNFNATNDDKTPLRTASSMNYAGFWRRVAAHFIDLIFILIPLSLVAGFIIGLIFGSFVYIETLQLLGGIAGLVITLLYYAIMNSSKRQATIGKRIMGLWVFDTNGQRLSFSHALGRIILKNILGILFIVMLFNERKQAVHDLIAKTVVLYSPE